MQDHARITKCLRQKQMEELTAFNFAGTTPSFLTAMGPSKDGILIPNDFGEDTLLDLDSDEAGLRRARSASVSEGSDELAAGDEVERAPASARERKSAGNSKMRKRAQHGKVDYEVRVVDRMKRL